MTVLLLYWIVETILFFTMSFMLPEGWPKVRIFLFIFLLSSFGLLNWHEGKYIQRMVDHPNVSSIGP